MSQFFNIKSTCVLCGDSTSQVYSLCKPCQGDFPLITNACQCCGLPIADVQEESHQVALCGYCLKTPPAIDYTQSLYYYESPIDYLVGQVKFEENLSCASILGHLLAKGVTDIDDDLPDVIIPVPLHKKRLFKRGFNQSLEIARPVAKLLQLPIDSNLVARTKSTRAQAKLNVAQRRKNIKGCFKVKDNHAYQHVVLIDDVITTGSTINELASALKQSGVKKVGVWSIARAILN